MTGGTGLVGSALDDTISDFSTDEWVFIGSSDVDLTCSYDTDLYFKKCRPDIVVHLAGIILPATSTDIEQYDSLISNTEINTNVFKCCRRYGVKKILACSTSYMVKGPPDLAVEKHFGYLHSKRHLQALCESYRRCGFGQVTELFVGNVYGYQDMDNSGRLIASLYQKLQEGEGDGTVVCTVPNRMLKNFIYNYDFAQIIKILVNYQGPIDNCLTIGHPDNITMENVMRYMSDICGKTLVSSNYSENVGSTPPIGDDLSKYGSIKWTSFRKGFGDMLFRKKLKSCWTLRQPSRKVTLGHFKATPNTYLNVFDSLRTGQLSYGKYSKQLEQEFALKHQVNHAILSNSGTSSLHVGIAAMKEYYGWSDGQEILVPSTTFVASVNVIISNGLIPVLVDVEPKYFSMDPNKIQAKITKNTVAIMVVHLFGQPSDMNPIMEIAERNGLRIMEDSCETMLAKYNGKYVGGFGDFAAFSTYVAHLITTGVGGLCTTNNPELAKLIRSLVNHGRNNIYIKTEDDDNVSDKNLFTEIVEKRFQFERVGFSYRITELESGLGVVELDMLEENIATRQRNAMYLTQKLKAMGLDKYFSLPAIRPESDHSFMIYPIVIIHPDVCKKELIMHLENKNIETRDLMPITTQPVYNGKIKELNLTDDAYEVSDRLNKHGFYIGCHQHLTLEDMDYVAAHMVTFIRELKPAVNTAIAPNNG